MASYFNTCDYCEQVAKRICDCSSPPRYLCDDHTLDHLNTEGNHTTKTSLISLSAEEISIIKQVVQSYQIESIRIAISTRNNLVSEFLEKIRKAEQECSSLIESALNGEIKQTAEQLDSASYLPLFSPSFFINILVSLKQSEAFTLTNILNQLLSPSSVDSTLFSQAGTEAKGEARIETKTNKEIETKKKNAKEEETVDSVPVWELSHEIQAHIGKPYLGNDRGFNREITCIAISDCKQYFASASKDDSIKIWDGRSLNLLRSLEGHTNWVLSVSFLGNNIVSGSGDNTIKIWEENRCTNTLSLHSSSVTSVCVSSSKKLIASGSEDTTVRVFDIENNRSLHTLQSHLQSVRSVAYSEDDREIVSGSDDGNIKIWKTETGELLKTLNTQSGYVLCVRTIGKLIVSSLKNNSIRVREREKPESMICLRGHTDVVTSLDLCKQTLASISEDETVRVWNLKSKKQVQSLRGHGYSGIFYIGSRYVGSLRILDEGRCIVSGGADGKIKIWRKVN